MNWPYIAAIILLFSIVLTTWIFYLIGSYHQRKAAISTVNELHEKVDRLEQRYEREMRSVSHDLRQVIQGITMMTSMSGVPWTMEPKPPEEPRTCGSSGDAS